MDAPTPHDSSDPPVPADERPQHKATATENPFSVLPADLLINLVCSRLGHTHIIRVMLVCRVLRDAFYRITYPRPRPRSQLSDPFSFDDSLPDPKAESDSEHREGPVKPLVPPVGTSSSSAYPELSDPWESHRRWGTRSSSFGLRHVPEQADKDYIPNLESTWRVSRRDAQRCSAIWARILQSGQQLLATCQLAELAMYARLAFSFLSSHTWYVHDDARHSDREPTLHMNTPPSSASMALTWGMNKEQHIRTTVTTMALWTNPEALRGALEWSTDGTGCPVQKAKIMLQPGHDRHADIIYPRPPAEQAPSALAHYPLDLIIIESEDLLAQMILESDEYSPAVTSAYAQRYDQDLDKYITHSALPGPQFHSDWDKRMIDCLAETGFQVVGTLGAGLMVSFLANKDTCWMPVMGKFWDRSHSNTPHAGHRGVFGAMYTSLCRMLRCLRDRPAPLTTDSETGQQQLDYVRRGPRSMVRLWPQLQALHGPIWTQGERRYIPPTPAHTYVMGARRLLSNFVDLYAADQLIRERMGISEAGRFYNNSDQEEQFSPDYDTEDSDHDRPPLTSSDSDDPAAPQFYRYKSFDHHPRNAMSPRDTADSPHLPNDSRFSSFVPPSIPLDPDPSYQPWQAQQPTWLIQQIEEHTPHVPDPSYGNVQLRIFQSRCGCGQTHRNYPPRQETFVRRNLVNPLQLQSQTRLGILDPAMLPFSLDLTLEQHLRQLNWSGTETWDKRAARFLPPTRPQDVGLYLMDGNLACVSTGCVRRSDTSDNPDGQHSPHADPGGPAGAL